MPSRRAADLTCFVFCVAALVPGVWSMWHVQWPFDYDGFRDIAIARSMLIRGWDVDAFYRGEPAWYNPLVPGAVAFTSWASGADVATTFVRLGIWLNALAPVAFYICARTLLGPPAAVMATVAFLFLPGRPEAWASATYSPWLFPAITAQIPFYVSLLSWIAVCRKPTMAGAIRTGLLIGITFLAHTAPALVLLATLWVSGFLVAWPRRRGLALQALTTIVALVIIVAFLVAPIAENGIHMKNRAPATWTYDPAQPSAWFAGLKRQGVLLLALAALGLTDILTKIKGVTRAVVVAWGAAAGACLVYALLAERLTTIPAIVPAYHFLFLMRAWKWLLVGAGAAGLARRMLPWLRQRAPLWQPALPQLTLSESGVTLALSVLLAAAVYPRHPGREAFTSAPERALAASRSDDKIAHDWILAHTTLHDVFAAWDVDSLTVIAPAGRFVVSVPAAFSNPYLDWERRAADRDRLMSAFANADAGALQSGRERYGVTHVLWRTSKDAPRIPDPGASFCKVFQTGEISIFRVCSAFDGWP